MSSRFLGSLSAALVLALCAVPARAQWNPDPYAGGAFLASGGGAPAIDSDGAGGAYVAWSGTGAHVQHVDALGRSTWGASGVTLSSVAATSIVIAADPGGGAVIVWAEKGSVISERLLAQRVDASGLPMWTAGGVQIAGGSLPKQNLRMISDGAGGAFVTWCNNRLLHGIETPFVAFALRVNGAGALPWGTGVVTLSTAGGEQVEPTLVPDGSGGVIVAWVDTRSTNAQVYAQRYDAAGTAQWAANGVSATLTVGQDQPEAASDGAGGMIVAWTDTRSGTHIYAQRLSGAGVGLWTVLGRPVCTATGAQSEPAVASDGAGGALVAFDDTRNGTSDIYCQRVDPSGFGVWLADGVAVTTAANAQQASAVLSDGGGGAIVKWTDLRSGINADLYAQRLGADGSARWTAGGIPVCTAYAPGSQRTIVAARSGGALVTWSDARSGAESRVFAQRLDPLGYLGDPAPRIERVRDVPNDQGGQLKLSWAASDLDDARALIDHYDVERWNGAGWVLQTSILLSPYGGGPRDYGLVVATSSDSVGPSSPWTVLRVKAVGAALASGAVWISPPDSGRSVDNLSPGAPTLAGSFEAGTAHLSWSAGTDRDLAGYRLYRGERPDFVPEAAARIADVMSTSYDDPAGAPAIYKLTAVDVHGNESPASSWAPPGIPIPAGDPGDGLSFAPPGPNPARESVTLAFRLPLPAEAELAVRDLAGRNVRVLMSGAQSAGPHRVRWDLRDGTGRLLPAGAYFASLRVGGKVRERRVFVVR